MVESILMGLAAFLGTLVVGSFVEYVVHRLMHRRIVLGKVHADHHVAQIGQGWFKEFLAYFIPVIPVIVVLSIVNYFLGWYWMGAGEALGGLIFSGFAAYAHQVQHEHPELAFWMPRPVHHIHHAHNMWHHNFGITSDIWDRIFGTYKYVDWRPERSWRQIRPWHFFQIQWF